MPVLLGIGAELADGQLPVLPSEVIRVVEQEATRDRKVECGNEIVGSHGLTISAASV